MNAESMMVDPNELVIDMPLDEWIANYIPLAPLDLRRKPVRTDDNTPTGETVDDVFAQHGGADADGDESEGA